MKLEGSLDSEIKLDWEQIDSCLSRLKVLGGWLVKIREWKKDFFNDTHLGMALTFYPDPNHEWLITIPEIKEAGR